MNIPLQHFLLRSLRRLGDGTTEGQLVLAARQVFPELTDGDIRLELGNLALDQLIEGFTDEVLRTRRWSLTQPKGRAHANQLG